MLGASNSSKTAPAGAPGAGLDILANTRVETCNTCHNDAVARSGQTHQNLYGDYTDASNLAIFAVIPFGSMLPPFGW